MHLVGKRFLAGTDPWNAVGDHRWFVTDFGDNDQRPMPGRFQTRGEAEDYADRLNAADLRGEQIS